MVSKAVTENAIILLKAGVDINDTSGTPYQLWQETMTTISNQEGFQHAYYGTQLENPSILQLMIDWDSFESHQKFIESPAYGPFGAKLMAILDSPPAICHFLPMPFPPTILSRAPVMEVATFYQTSPQFPSNVEKFVSIIDGKADGCLGVTFGNVVEEIEKEPGTGKGKAMLLAIGWESREKHVAFRETSTFKENVHLLRDGMKDVEMHHVSFKGY